MHVLVCLHSVAIWCEEFELVCVCHMAAVLLKVLCFWPDYDMAIFLNAKHL